MLSLNPWTLLFTVCNALILFIGLKVFLFKPVMKIIQAREEMIEAQFESASKSQSEAEQMRIDYQEKLHTAQETAEEIITKAKERADQEHKRMIEETRCESEAMLMKAKADIQTEQEKAKLEVQVEVARLAMNAARKIMKTGDTYDTGSN